MPPRSSLILLFSVVFMSAPPVAAPAVAMCNPGDFVCQKFSGPSEPRSTARPERRTRPAASRSRPAEPVARAPARPAPIPSTDPEEEGEIQTSMVSPIPSTAPPVQLTTLAPGSIDTPPGDLGTLVFGSNDRIESATARCQPHPKSLRRLDCTVAIHRLALTSGPGAGCLATLKVRDVELTKDEAGRWQHEEAIALCGGRLIRRTEVFPVALDGEPQFALKERYELIGGDQTCAAPYLRTRQPLDRAFLPLGHGRTRQLDCGRITAR